MAVPRASSTSIWPCGEEDEWEFLLSLSSLPLVRAKGVGERTGHSSAHFSPALPNPYPNPEAGAGPPLSEGMWGTRKGKDLGPQQLPRPQREWGEKNQECWVELWL